MDQITRILQALQNIHQPGMQDTLNDLLDELSSLSGRCMNYSDEIQKAFDTWLLMVAELHTATEQKSGNVSQEQAETESKKAAAQIEETYTKKSLDNATLAAGRMKESLDKAEKAFQKANDDVPSGKSNTHTDFLVYAFAHLSSLGDLPDDRCQWSYASWTQPHCRSTAVSAHCC